MQTDSADGKLVEAEGLGGGQDFVDPKSVDGVTVNTDEKLDSIQLEYTYLLTSQLEAQRRYGLRPRWFSNFPVHFTSKNRYYEEKITRLEQTTNHEMEEMTAVARRAAEERKELEQKLSVVTKEKTKTDQKVSQLSGKVSKMASELGEERQLNKSLRSYQAEWQKKLSEADTKAKEIEKQKNAEIVDLKVSAEGLRICKS